MSQTIFGLAGQTALVTSAGRSMGVGIAHMLRRLGAKAVVNDFYAERTEETVAELRKEGIDALAAPADMTDYKQVAAMITKVTAETGRSGITVNALSLGSMNNWDSDAMAKKTCFVPRAGRPDDVGAGVAYFASKEASWVTGQVLPLNGGSLTA